MLLYFAILPFSLIYLPILFIIRYKFVLILHILRINPTFLNLIFYNPYSLNISINRTFNITLIVHLYINYLIMPSDSAIQLYPTFNLFFLHIIQLLINDLISFHLFPSYIQNSITQFGTLTIPLPYASQPYSYSKIHFHLLIMYLLKSEIR